MIRKAAEFAFLLLIFSLAFMRPEVTFLGPSITVTDAVFLVTLALFAVAAIKGQTELRFDRIFLLFALYWIALLLSAMFSVEPRISIIKLAGETYLLMLAMLAANIVRTRAMLKSVVYVWTAASLAVAVIGVLGVAFFYLGVSNFVTEIALHEYGQLPPGNYTRIHSTFNFPSMLCNYLTVSTLMLFAARRLGWIGRGVFLTALVLFAITTAFTFTAGLGAAILAVALWFYFDLGERGLTVGSRAVLAGGILSVLVFIAASAFTVIPTTTSPYYFEIAGIRVDPNARLLTWQGALDTFLAHPLFGKGLGLAVAEVSFREPSGGYEMLADAHNSLLSVAAQSGVLAAVALVFIAAAVLRRSFPFSLSRSNALRTALGIAFLSSFIIQGIVGSFEDARHLWVLMGLMIAFRDLDKDAAETTMQASP